MAQKRLWIQCCLTPKPPPAFPYMVAMITCICLAGGLGLGMGAQGGRSMPRKGSPTGSLCKVSFLWVPRCLKKTLSRAPAKQRAPLFYTCPTHKFLPPVTTGGPWEFKSQLELRVKCILGCDGELVTYCHIGSRGMLKKGQQTLNVPSCARLQKLTVNKAILSTAILSSS